MITVTKHLPKPPCPAPWERLLPEHALIFDIETTGFSPKTGMVYLIGVLYCHEHSWQLTQWLAESSVDEPALLRAFSDTLKDCTHLVHFNGDAFDLPFLQKRMELCNLSLPAEHFISMDLYRRLRPLKKLLGLPAMNLKALEEYLGLCREDTMDGGKLISIFHRFARSGSQDDCTLLLLHNHDDLLGTAGLLPLLSYLQLTEGNYSLSSPAEWKREGDTFDLILRLQFPLPLPKPFSTPLSEGHLFASDRSCSIRIRGFCGTLKHFFPDYRNYYYLPEEDMAIHKSVAAYVDRKYRTQAKPFTCYCKKTGLFLPCAPSTAMPLFYQEYKDTLCFLECTESFLKDIPALLAYASEYIGKSLS